MLKSRKIISNVPILKREHPLTSTKLGNYAIKKMKRSKKLYILFQHRLDSNSLLAKYTPKMPSGMLNTT